MPVLQSELKAFAACLRQERSPATINSMLSAVNHLLKFLDREDCKIKFLRLQRKAFRDQNRELTRNEYQKLLDTAADQRQERLGLLMETICATGIRVSEVQYITVKAAQTGRAEINLKGKIRTILLPAKLCRKLLKYARKSTENQGLQKCFFAVLGFHAHFCSVFPCSCLKMCNLTTKCKFCPQEG